MSRKKINIKEVPGTKINGDKTKELVISNLKLPPVDPPAKQKEKKPEKSKGLKSIKPPEKIRTEIVKGKYFFTEEEKANMSGSLAQKQIDKRIVEDERKSVMSDYKDRLDRFAWEINRLARGVVDGFEMRDFECRIVKDFEGHVKIYHDIHSGREIDRRPLDPSDYQQTMPGIG